MTDWVIVDEHGRVHGTVMASSAKEALARWVGLNGHQDGLEAVPAAEVM